MKRAVTRIPVIVLLTLCWLPLALPATAETAPKIKRIDPPRQILFVGNSFIYYNSSLHAHLRNLISAADPENESKYFLRAMTISGSNLPEHTGAFPAMLLSRKWDVVVLQGRSTEPIDPKLRPGYEAAATLFSSLAREAGVTTALFMTWALEDKPEMTAPLRESVTSLGNRLEALVVPVGLAFERARAQRPDFAVHNADKLHSSLAGTYLAACVFYSAFFEKSAVGNSYAAGLSPEDAAFLQRVAWETVQSFYRKEPT